MKKAYFLLFLMLFSLTFVSAEAIPQRQDAQLDEPYIISQPCASCSYINISVFTKDGVVLDNVPMTDNGSTWTYTFTPNTSLRHDVNGIGDINGNDDSFAFWFDVTLSGEPTQMSKVGANVVMFIFFGGLIIGLAVLQRKIDFEAWNKKIVRKYEYSNFMKVILAGTAYSFFKDSFLIYYILGWPLLILLQDIVFTFGIESIYNIFNVLLDIYSVGFWIVGAIFISSAWNFLHDLYKQFENGKWGLNQ